MSDGYAVQINVKVGDHLINVQGDSAEEAMKNLSDLVTVAPELHEHLSRLDGRPATEIVQKEKQWGARSQYGRTYPKSATASTTQPSTQNPTSVQNTAEQLLKDQLGATVVGTETHSTVVGTETHSTPQQSSPSTDGKVHNGQCPHGTTQKSGSKNGKNWTANFCNAKVCSPEWL